ncbi:MAG: hypothetical protein RL478_1207 [Actinomycetota bacterium]
MVGVPGSSPVAPTRDLENDVGNECRNDSDRADGDGKHLNGVASKQLIRVVRILTAHLCQIERQLWQNLLQLCRIVR